MRPVDGNARAHRAAKQLVNRHSQGFAFDVEQRVLDRVNTVTTLFGATGTQILSGGYSTAIDGATPGPYRVESANHGELYPGINKTTTLSMAVDSSRTDYLPPTLTTMMLLDGSGSLVSRLDPHGSGSLLFSAADFGLTPTGSRIYQTIRGDATHISYRYNGEAAWRPLTTTQVTEDVASGAGILYRVDLAHTKRYCVCVLLPAHLGRWIDATKLVDQPLETCTQPKGPDGPPFHDVGHVEPKWLYADQQQQEEHCDERNRCRSHQNFSGLNIA